MNAQDFANSKPFPVVFYAGNGCPAGQSIAILDSTELPFDLSEMEGSISESGILEVENLNDGSGAHGWQFADFNSNTVYKVQVFHDEKIWTEQEAEYNSYA